MRINKRIDRYLITSHSGVPTTQVSILLYDDNNAQIGHIIYRPDDQDLPENRITQTGMVFLYKHSSYAPVDIDILRNEKPLFIQYNDNTKFGFIATSAEPVGEEELL